MNNYSVKALKVTKNLTNFGKKFILYEPVHLCKMSDNYFHSEVEIVAKVNTTVTALNTRVKTYNKEQ